MRGKSGDFEFEYTYLWDLEAVQKEKDDKSKIMDPNFNGYTISDLAKDIVHGVSISIPGLRRGKSLLLKPNHPLVVGSFLSGRPHVHLLNFQGQCSTARQNEAKFQNEFGWIMGGAYQPNSKLGKQFLPINARKFDDYGAYVDEQSTLWAWSKKGISQAKKNKIPNNGHLIYFNQSQCEVLEYGYMLHRRMLELVGSIKNHDNALDFIGNKVLARKNTCFQGYFSNLLPISDKVY